MSPEVDGLARELGQAVRDEIRAAFIEEFEALGEAGRRTAEALEAVRRVASVRMALWATVVVICCSVIPVAIVRMVLPTHEDLIHLRGERDSLQAHVAQLAARGGRIDLRRCGVEGRLCARVEPAAPRYGADGDYYILKGY
jgi:hypothetical protein